MRAGSALVAVLLALGCAGCRSLLLGSHTVPRCEVLLRPSDEIPGDFLLRQRVRISFDERELPLELALEKRAGALVLLGFDAFGAKLFAITQRGVETEVEALPPPALEVPPLNVLGDVHRVRFLANEPPPDGAGETSAVRNGVRIRETWDAGRLLRRSFEPGGVQVDFEADRALVSHPDCGYSASFVTLERRELR